MTCHRRPNGKIERKRRDVSHCHSCLYLHIMAGWAEPLEQKYRESRRLNGHQGNQHPAAGVEGLWAVK